MKTVGIDYSMTSPSICVHYGEDWSIRNCQFYFLTDRPKLEGKTNQFNGTLHPIHSCEEQRYDNISNWAMSIIQPVDANRIVLEGYSFGSTGRVFHIAENIGLLKHKMWEAESKFDVIAPTAIKKFATVKGNANKEKMQESFIAETNIDVKLVLSQSEKQWSPSGDIIDSYYMCKYAHHLATTGEQPDDRFTTTDPD